MLPVLRSQGDYDGAVAEIDRLLDPDPQPSTPDYDWLELLSVLVEYYEARHHPIDDGNLTPQGVVDFVLQQRGMSRADLAPLMGGPSRVSDFFNGRRAALQGEDRGTPRASPHPRGSAFLANRSVGDGGGTLGTRLMRVTP